ncbi:trigger factor [Dongia rigui]|uniref:Trigger factor n=1 Tax=Dongia rigui TaxID=940149 RepID=A0ABU5E4D0_9PROT|nr:trigger factor [Dongia rigui]MDY0874217.1 trigger factor [Dongia rigui]
MQVTETLNQGLKREYKIAVPAAALREKVDGKLNELSHKLKIPGFRPGKVPMSLLKQRYEQSVMGEVLEESVQQSSQQLMTERNLRPAGQPKVELVGEFKDGADLEFSVAMEVIPEVTPMDFTTVSLERVGVEVPETEVEESLKRIAKRQRASDPVDDAAANGDIVVIDFVGSIDGVEFEGGKADGHHLELGSGQFIPGFEEQLVGAKKGDKKTVKVTFPAEYGNSDLAGKEASFGVTVQEVRRLKDVPVDDELAKSLGLTDLAELKKQARERIEKEYGAVARARVKRKLLDVLADNHNFTLPESLVEAEFGAIWQQIEADMKADRLDEEDKGKSEEVLKKEYRDIAERRVKLGLLLSEVGRQNNIQVPNEELSRALIQEAQRYPGQQQQVIEYYQRSPEALNQLRAPLYEEKVVDYILERAKVSERKVSPEAFAAEGEAELKGRRD